MEAWLKEFRENSLEKFRSLHSENSELFKHQTLFKDFENKNELGDLTSNTGIRILDNPKGVPVKSLKDAELREFLEKFDIDDKFMQMNNATFSSGAIIEVPENVSGGVLRISASADSDLFSKLIILMGEGSSLFIVKESYSADETPRTISEDVLVVAEPESGLIFSELQNYNQASTCFTNKIAVCGKDSKVVWNLGFFGGRNTRSRTYNFLEGEGSYVEDLQLTFGGSEQCFDAFTNLIHRGRSTSAKAIAKGAFRDKSSSIFKGMIKIEGQAKNASSYLACHGMLLSKDAKANAIPSLEIETNDVKATHAASVAPIDEEKIFYLTCRGISREDAKKMITLGFFDPLVRKVVSDEIRAKIRYLVESKWDGQKIDSFESKMLKEFMAEDVVKSGDIFEGHYKYR